MHEKILIIDVSFDIMKNEYAGFFGDPYIRDVAHVVRVILCVNFLPIFVKFS